MVRSQFSSPEHRLPVVPAESHGSPTVREDGMSRGQPGIGEPEQRDTVLCRRVPRLSEG